MLHHKGWGWLTMGALALLTGVLLGACTTTPQSVENPDVTPTPIPTSVVASNPTYTVQRGDVVRELKFSGRVAPIYEEALFFRQPGYVEAFYVQRNDAVKKGDLLAELEVTDLKNQIAQAETDLQAAQMDNAQRVAEAEAEVRRAELQVARLKTGLSETESVAARINRERARLNVQAAQDEYNKSLDRPWEEAEVRQAYSEGLREARWGLEIAEAAYTDAQHARERQQYDIELAAQDLKLAQMRRNDIAAGIDVTRTQLALQRLRDQLAEARIVAPFDGVLLSLGLSEGKQVQGYEAVMVIADPTHLEISASLTDNEMRELTEGISLTVKFVNRPADLYRGQVRHLPYPFGGGGRTEAIEEEDKSVRITLTDVDIHALNPIVGERVEMTVELERANATLWLPPQAIRTFEGRTFVVIRDSSTQRRVDVRLGIQAIERVEILDGLQEGQTVVAP